MFVLEKRSKERNKQRGTFFKKLKKWIHSGGGGVVTGGRERRNLRL